MSGDCAARCRRTPLPWPCPARPGAVAAPTAPRAAPRACRCPRRAAATATCAACSARSATAAPMPPGSPPVTPPVLAQLSAGGCRLRLRLPPRCARHRRLALPSGAGRAARAAVPACRRRCRCAPAPPLRPLLHCSLPPPPRRACPRPAHRWPARTSPATVPHPRARGHRHRAVRRSCCLCRIWGRVAATPPVFAGLHGGAAVDTAAATAAAAACAVRCQPIVGAVAPPLPRLHASDHAAAGYRP